MKKFFTAAPVTETVRNLNFDCETVRNKCFVFARGKKRYARLFFAQTYFKKVKKKKQ